jgi:orotidine-5'-phosphate decarboxylase
MLATARAALDDVADAPQLLAVTVLTSMDAAQLNATGVKRSPAEQVELLAHMGWEAGIRGFVCSPQEVTVVRALTGAEGVLVVPGIRPAGAEAAIPSHSDDQKRMATPANALSAGASYLVVGRPITQAHEPAKAAEAILQEMAQAIAL